MTADEILAELQTLGSPSIKKILMRHGAREPFYGVKIEELKKFQKRIKKDYQLALDLYATGVSDAMYLAGLIADDQRMTKKDLQRWVKAAYWHMLSGCTVAWVAAGSPHGRELALEWIDSKAEQTAVAGWCTLSSLVALKDDADLDLPELKRLLARVAKTIHDQPNRVREAMNGFIIAVGSYVPALTDLALTTAEQIGKVEVDVGDTACEVPWAPDYIRKVKDRGALGKKRKTVKC
jgi:3-methyladenine DNA glycosylase AlkD